MFRRSINISNERSFFLFGARGTGKTTLLRERFADARWIDLLDASWERRLARNPNSLADEVQAINKSGGNPWIVIDEIQKLPTLLDVVQRLIVSKANVKFALTGSSARKLKRGGANLLAGRALTYSLFPLTHVELGSKFDLDAALSWGTLPEAVTIADPTVRAHYLDSYCSTYLKEEVFAEQLTRKLTPFRLFLELAANENGHALNFDKIARDVGVDGKTVANYYEILEDTWLGTMLPASSESFRKKQRLKPKFYFFDVGVVRALAGTLDIKLRAGTNFFGDLFEHFIIIEAFRLNAYQRPGYRFAYLESQGGREVDLVLEKTRRPPVFVEIKSTDFIHTEDLRTLRTLVRERVGSRAYCLSRDPNRRTEDGVEIVPWEDGLREIFSL